MFVEEFDIVWEEQKKHEKQLEEQKKKLILDLKGSMKEEWRKVVEFERKNMEN